MTQARRPSDFNPDDLTKKSDQHDKLLGALEKRVGTNENFGKTFAEASGDSKSIENAVEGIVVRLLAHNIETRTAVVGIVDDIDGRQMKKQLLGLGKIGLWVLSLIVTALITVWITIIVTNANEKSQTPTTSPASQSTK